MFGSEQDAIIPRRPSMAAKLAVPLHKLVSVEHPCIIHDVDRAIKSLGGERQVQHLLEFHTPGTGPVTLSLRPDDPFATRIPAKPAQVDDLLLQVTLPRWTGRKRRRGTDEPFTHHPTSIDAGNILRMLQDNQDDYEIFPVGRIKTVHRFRTLPDFQFAASDVSIMKKVARCLINPSLSDIKSFQLDTSVGGKKGASIIGPPQGTSFAQQLHYLYEQNPAVMTTTDDSGNMVTINTQAPRKRDMYAISADVAEVPQGPPKSLPQINLGHEDLLNAVKYLGELLQKRPIVTRRVALNLMDWASEGLFKVATQYVGYSFRSGPWRDALVRYGLDPRKDPQYRIYQTIVFKMAPKGKATRNTQRLPDGRNKWLRTERYQRDTSGGTPTHIFDGKGVSTNGKTWQICDVTDPLIKNLFASAPLRAICDLDNWGWYQNGTMSIGRVIMRDKAQLMLQNFDPAVYDEVYARIAALSATLDESTMEEYSFAARKAKTLMDVKAQELTAAIRAIAKVDLKSRGLQFGVGAGRARPGWMATSGNGKEPMNDRGNTHGLGDEDDEDFNDEDEDDDDDDDDDTGLGLDVDNEDENEEEREDDEEGDGDCMG